MRIQIINGPNLNLLGKREVDIYGRVSFEEYFAELKQGFPNEELYVFQSNHEGALIDKIHEVGYSFDGIILNGGAYTHTSIALADAIAAIQTPVIEVHISNIFARESYQWHSYTANKCKGLIIGLGLEVYRLGVTYFANKHAIPFSQRL